LAYIKKKKEALKKERSFQQIDDAVARKSEAEEGPVSFRRKTKGPHQGQGKKRLSKKSFRWIKKLQWQNGETKGVTR